MLPVWPALRSATAYNHGEPLQACAPDLLLDSLHELF